MPANSNSNRDARGPHFLVWPLILGAVGFVCGFFGPIVLNPDANQGPLVGLFLSGPAGAFLGLILAAICAASNVRAALRWQILGTVTAVLAVTTLAFCTPGPALRGYIVETQIRGCSSPADRVDSAIEYWTKRVSQVTWAAPRAEWQPDAREQLNERSAVILDTTLVRRKGIYESRRPWSLGRLSASEWREVNQQQTYYADSQGGSCSSYAAGLTSTQFVPYDSPDFVSNALDWPPR
ncbi:MAG: hypothetical protein ACRD40_00730 [Candidatus Acidiferrales bacterium]